MTDHVFRIGALFGANGRMTYTGPREGSDLLPWEGPSTAEVVSGTPGKGFNEPHHPNISWTLRLTDPDCNGSTIVTNKALTGNDTSGGANERHTADLMLSCGLFGPTDEVNLQNTLAAMEQWFLANGGLEGLITAEWIIANCVGKKCVVDIGSSVNPKNDTEMSTVDNFITRATYDQKAKNPGMFRQPRRTPVAKQPRGVTAGVGAPQNIGGPSVPGRPSPVALANVAPPRPGVPQQQFVTQTGAPLAQAQSAGGFVQPAMQPPFAQQPNGAQPAALPNMSQLAPLPR
jgi:hypothetical protein